MYSKSLPAFAGLVYLHCTISAPRNLPAPAGTIDGLVTDPPELSSPAPRSNSTIRSPATAAPLTGHFRRVPLPQRPAESLPGCGLRHRLYGEHAGRGRALQRSAGAQIALSLAGSTPPSRWKRAAWRCSRSVPYAHNDVDRELYSEAAHLRPGQRTERRDHAGEPRRGGRFQRLLPPAGRSRANQLFRSTDQPISDQQSKQFSTQIPLNAIQSMELITGAPGAEFGDKTSLVVNAVTRSGLGQKPFGSFAAQYRLFRRDRRRGHARPRRQKAAASSPPTLCAAGASSTRRSFVRSTTSGNSQTIFDQPRLAAQPPATLFT